MIHTVIYLDEGRIFFDDEKNKITVDKPYCEAAAHILTEMLNGNFTMEYIKKEAAKKFRKGILLEVGGDGVIGILDINEICPELDWDCVVNAFNEIFKNSLKKESE